MRGNIRRVAGRECCFLPGAARRRNRAPLRIETHKQEGTVMTLSAVRIAALAGLGTLALTLSATASYAQTSRTPHPPILEPQNTECFEDEGYGRKTPCDSGFKQKKTDESKKDDSKK
jgi:hypothetical protein